jgi:8-oxo-dGTP pyrophosphatase MutT (NUDIX family)
MKLLKTIRERDIFPGSELINKESGYIIRKAARAVVFDKDNKIALLKISKHNYFKLPGGGVEKGEDLFVALKRECLEETGCQIIVKNEIGKILEFREFDPGGKLQQESFCYLAYVNGEKGEPSFTEEEVKGGFQLLWISLKDAINLLKTSKPDTYVGKFIIVRDLIFLLEIQNL